MELAPFFSISLVGDFRLLAFVFDFKARGQWKHWNDVVKTMDVPEKMSVHVVIPTVDTARYVRLFSGFTVLVV